MKVLTIEQMNKLKELGVDVSNASVRVGQMVFYHGDSLYGVDSYNVHLLKDDDDDTSCFEEEYKAFTLQIYRDWETDRKSTRLNSSHSAKSRMPSSA